MAPASDRSREAAEDAELLRTEISIAEQRLDVFETMDAAAWRGGSADMNPEHSRTATLSRMQAKIRALKDRLAGIE